MCLASTGCCPWTPGPQPSQTGLWPSCSFQIFFFLVIPIPDICIYVMVILNYHSLLFIIVVLSRRILLKSVIFLHTGQSHVITEVLEILKPQSLELLCNLTDIPSKPSNITGFWRKDGDEIENSQQTIYRQNEQYVLKKMYV